MSEDSYTEVTSESWFGRIGGAFKGIIVGLVLFVVAFPLLFWNEGRSVETWKTLQEGGKAVVSVPATSVDPANEGKLVHLSGKAVTEATLSDPVFGATANAIRLLRRVEMYQWKESSKSETKKKLGGGTETVTEYTYSKEWASQPISSSNFKRQDGHENPASMPYESLEQEADNVMLGAFQLPSSLISQIRSAQPLTLDSDSVLPTELVGKVKRHEGGLYLGAEPKTPQVGDLRIKFEMVPQTEVSIIAMQTRNTLAAYHAKAGGSIERLQGGTVSAEEMFKQAKQENTVITWILRALGLLLMYAGLAMVFKPLSVIGDVVPFIGSIVGAGTGFISFLIAGALSMITIAIAWIVYRPLLGIILLAAAIALIFIVKRKTKATSAKVTTASAPVMPPPPPPMR